MRCLLAALGLIGLISPAFAADYELPTLRGSDMFVPAYPVYPHWDGIYVGGHLGFGNAGVDFTKATQPLLAVSLRSLAFESEFHASAVSVLGTTDTNSAGVGGFVGYNVQFEDAVLGLEFNYTHNDFNAVATSNPISRLTGVLSNGKAYAFTYDGSGSMRTTDIGLFQVRGGYAWGHFMPFATVGLALGRADVALAVSCSCQEKTPNPIPPGVGFINSVDFSFSQSQADKTSYLWGLTAGVGMEWALTPNIFARADYQYIAWQQVTQITSYIQMSHVGLGVRF
jgi:opacity protein-like surface antigen